MVYLLPPPLTHLFFFSAISYFVRNVWFSLRALHFAATTWINVCPSQKDKIIRKVDTESLKNEKISVNFLNFDEVYMVSLSAMIPIFESSVQYHDYTVDNYVTEQERVHSNTHLQLNNAFDSETKKGMRRVRRFYKVIFRMFQRWQYFEKCLIFYVEPSFYYSASDAKLFFQRIQSFSNEPLKRVFCYHWMEELEHGFEAPAAHPDVRPTFRRSLDTIVGYLCYQASIGFMLRTVALCWSLSNLSIFQWHISVHKYYRSVFSNCKSAMYTTVSLITCRYPSMEEVREKSESFRECAVQNLNMDFSRGQVVKI